MESPPPQTTHNVHKTSNSIRSPSQPRNRYRPTPSMTTTGCAPQPPPPPINTAGGSTRVAYPTVSPAFAMAETDAARRRFHQHALCVPRCYYHGRNRHRCRRTTSVHVAGSAISPLSLSKKDRGSISSLRMCSKSGSQEILENRLRLLPARGNLGSDPVARHEMEMLPCRQSPSVSVDHIPHALLHLASSLFDAQHRLHASFVHYGILKPWRRERRV